MGDTFCISICCCDGSIRLFKSTVRGLNTPAYVKIYVHKTKALLAVTPDEKRTFTTHKTPSNIYDEKGRMVIYSKKLCTAIYQKMNWNKDKLYRIPGEIIKEEKVAYFDLSKADVWDRGRYSKRV